MVSDVESKLAHMEQVIGWGKQSHHHHVISMAYTSEALLKVADAALKEHASHFDKYKEDEEGCATCFYLHELLK